MRKTNLISMVAMLCLASFLGGLAIGRKPLQKWKTVEPLIEGNIKVAEEDMAAFYVWYHTRALEPLGDQPEDHDRYQRNKRWLQVRDALNK